MYRTLPALFVVGGLLAAGCNTGKITLGAGPEADARLVADVFTWKCADFDSSGSVESEWLGVLAFEVALSYAPDGLEEEAFPSPGDCAEGVVLFPGDAGDAGSSIPDIDDEPDWAGATRSGELTDKGHGFYIDEVTEDYLGCTVAEEALSEGVTISDAGALDGATTPAAGELENVEFDPDPSEGVEFGDEIDIEWEVSGWDTTWIQVRQERDGEAWVSVTCNTTGEDDFKVDSAVWDLLNPDFNSDVINLYVGFQNEDDQVTEADQKVHTYSRAIHVAVVQED
jgi:hypothetical protein